MRILIATDVFPPACGGSGWSTYELARGLRSRGHQVRLVRPQTGSTAHPGYDGFKLASIPASAPNVPFVRNYVRNERLYRRVEAMLGEMIAAEGIDIVHAQHVLTGPGAIRAARRASVPSVCTVRDFWPVCYWGDLIQSTEAMALCAGCSQTAMTRCVRPHAGAAWPLALSAIPYMRANLRLKQRDLAGATAIVAVSRRMATELRQRSPELESARIVTIPNAVDVGAVRARVERSTPPLAVPYAIFVGKLARNKGVGALVDVVARARLDIPLVVVGDGPDRGALESAAARASRDLRVLGWLDRDEVFRWLYHARLLLFPSGWHEPLSRVLIEASALGVPIAAMDTGGTSDIVTDEETGLLADSIDGLAANAARLASDADLRRRLGAGARAAAAERFDTPVVLDRMERLYDELVSADGISRNRDRLSPR